jgi:hypothetical protein
MSYADWLFPSLCGGHRGAGTLTSSFTQRGQLRRVISLVFAASVVVTPCAILVASLPGSGNNGFIDIGSLWLWHRSNGQPFIILDGSEMRIFLVAICVVLAELLVQTAISNHADHGLLFGGVTIFAALTWAAAFVSVFARRHVEDQAGRMFALLAVLSVVMLVLAAYDWGRRQLLIGSLIIGAALSLFVIRTGFESLKVPPQWERAQIADQAFAGEGALTLQYTQDLHVRKGDVLDARNVLRDILNGVTKPNIDTALSNTAGAILAQAGQPPAAAANSPDFATFDTEVTNEAPSYPPAEATKLADAVHALQAAESAAAPPASTAALNQAICNVYPPSGKCGKTTPITTNALWVTAQHDLNVQLATYRAQVTGTPADQAALQAVLAQQPDVDHDISILDAIEDGPQALWRSFFHATGPALIPGPLGWVVFGAVLLGLLTWLLRVNATQLPGPVNVTPVGTGSSTSGSSGNTDEQLTAELRVAVLQNVTEPGAAPGSPSINPVTTLLGIAGGPMSPISKIIQAVLAIVGNRHGYEVTIDITSGDLATPGLAAGAAAAAATSPAATATATTAREVIVLVRVISLASGITCASHLCTAPDELQAVRTAGLWAAGEVLNRSSRIPHWAAWQADTAHALVTAKHKNEHTIPALEAALCDAPNSGILLVLLGHHYELAGRPLDAIECYGRAVTAYPRYSVARYRLAAALALMRHDRTWRGSPRRFESEGSMLRAVAEAVGTLMVDGSQAIAELEKKEDSDRSAFGVLAASLLRSLETDTKWWWLAVGALRRSERQSIWPALVPMSKHPAARFPALVTSARQTLTDAPDWGRLGEEAVADGSWWQISYNAACAHAASIPGCHGGPDAKRLQADSALRFLEQTLVRPGVEQLSAAWVGNDPDFAALRADPRFKRFLAQLRPGE